MKINLTKLLEKTYRKNTNEQSTDASSYIVEHESTSPEREYSFELKKEEGNERAK